MSRAKFMKFVLFSFNKSSQVRKFAAFPLFSALLLAGVACQKRQFNHSASPQTSYSFSQPRFAFSNAGLGWCYYIEDAATKAELFRTKHVYVDVGYDLDTNIERRDRFQRIFALRSFKKAHEVAINFDAFSKWSQPLFAGSIMTSEVFSAIVQVEKELSLVRSDLEKKGYTRHLCEKRAAEDSAAQTAGRPLSDDDSAIEYRLRCQDGAEQPFRHTEAEMLSPEGYKLIQSALHELATDKKWESFRRTGVKCRDGIKQLESSRGRYLGSDSIQR